MVVKDYEIGDKPNDYKMKVVDNLRSLLNLSDLKDSIFGGFDFERIILAAWLKHINNKDNYPQYENGLPPDIPNYSAIYRC
jgi:hypothetical protein